eukprot:PITA_32177
MNKPDVNAHIIRWFLLLQQFHLTIIDNPGKENVVADFLFIVNLPTGEEGMVDDQMLDEHLFSISVLSPWFVDIANYLVSTQFPPHLSSKEKSKIVRKSTPFTWIGGNLFKLGPDQILRRCVREEEVFDILLTCHDGPCGGHFAAKRIAFKIASKLLLANSSSGYQVSQFTSNLIEHLLTHHKIKHKTSTPYHPQANGQVEFTKIALEGILTKVVSSIRKDWADRLVKATWAYNTTWKTTTGFAPYELVYRKKDLLSIEFEFNTLKMAAQLDLDLSYAQKERLLQLNRLDEYRLQTLLHTDVVQLQKKTWHDRNIRKKQFQEGDWALLYDSRYKDFKGKLTTRWLGPYTVEKCNDNGSVLIRTIDDEAIPMLVNGHRLKVYKKPLSR